MSKHLPYDRAGRVADRIFEAVSMAFVSSISDPDLCGVSVTRVKVTKDIRTARIFYHLANATEERKADAQGGFARVAGLLKRRIGEEMVLKYMPELDFIYDDSVDAAERMEEIFKGLQKGEGS